MGALLTEPRRVRRLRPFYGWWVAAGCFVLLVLHSGTGFYSFGLFVGPLEAEFGWSRGSVMIAISAYFGAQAAMAPLIGKAIDRLGAPRVMTAGAALSTLALVMLSQTRSLAMFVGGYVLFGAGHGALGHIPASVVVSHWFARRRGMAIGLVGGGIGMGALIMAPVVGAWIIPAVQWRGAYLVLATLTAAVGLPVALWVIRPDPAVMGLLPDGGAAGGDPLPGEPEHGEPPGRSLGAALRTRSLWLIFFTFFAINLCAAGLLANQVPHLEAVGYPVVEAAGALGVVGLGSVAGKFAFGWLCDVVAPRHATVLGLGLMVAGVALFMSITPGSPKAQLWVYAVAAGVGLGSWLPTMSMLTSATFGLGSFGAIWGSVAAVHSIGGAVGPIVFGLIFDQTGSYRPALILSLVLLSAAAVAMLLARQPGREK